MWNSAATLCNLCAALDFPLWENLTCEHTIDFNWKSVCHSTQCNIFRCGFKIRIAEKKRSECHFLTWIPSWIFSLKSMGSWKSMPNPYPIRVKIVLGLVHTAVYRCRMDMDSAANSAPITPVFCLPSFGIEIPRVSIEKQRMVLLILDKETASKIYMTAPLKWS